MADDPPPPGPSVPSLVVVGGECLLDVIARPGADPVARPGGAPANVARGVARLGGRSLFLGAVSDDADGRLLREALTADGVDPRALVTSDRPTSVAHATLGPDGSASYRFVLDGTSAAAVTIDDARRAGALDPAAIYVGGLALGLEPIGAALEALVVGAGPDVLVAVDPNCRPGALPDPFAHAARFDRLLARVDLVKASVEDLEVLHPGVPAQEAAAALLERGPRAVLVTAGGEAVAVLTRSGRDRIPVPRADVVDTVGAGDAFAAAVLAWWTTRRLGREALADLPLVTDAARWAARVAAMTCERAGAQPPRLDEVLAAG